MNKHKEKFVNALCSCSLEYMSAQTKKLIFEAEDMNFSIEQSKKVSEWLLSFAEKWKNEVEEEDDTARNACVFSAIRTGASMLHIQNLKRLFPLIGNDCCFSVNKVTIKMLGRIAEASHPDYYYREFCSDIAIYVGDYVEKYFNKESIENSSQSTALIQLYIYFLAAIKFPYPNFDERLDRCIEMNITWFNEMIYDDFQRLKEEWGGDTYLDHCLEKMNEFKN